MGAHRQINRIQAEISVSKYHSVAGRLYRFGIWLGAIIVQAICPIPLAF